MTICSSQYQAYLIFHEFVIKDITTLLGKGKVYFLLLLRQCGYEGSDRKIIRNPNYVFIRSKFTDACSLIVYESSTSRWYHSKIGGRGAPSGN